jgi:hypothetical protein
MEIRPEKSSHGISWLIFSPLFALISIICFGFATMLVLGAMPLNDVTGLICLSIIAIGLLTGLVSLIIEDNLRLGWKLLIAIAYVPIVVISLLLSGF